MQHEHSRPWAAEMSVFPTAYFCIYMHLQMYSHTYTLHAHTNIFPLLLCKLKVAKCLAIYHNIFIHMFLWKNWNGSGKFPFLGKVNGLLTIFGERVFEEGKGESLSYYIQNHSQDNSNMQRLHTALLSKKATVSTPPLQGRLRSRQSTQLQNIS